MASIKFRLTGITALLMHQDDVDAADRLMAWRRDPANKGRTVAGDDRAPGWTWQTYCYSDGQRLTIPSANLMVALREAGKKMILKKQTTFKQLSQSGMYIASEFLDFRCGDPLRNVAMEDITDVAELPFSEQADSVRDLGFRLFVKRATVGGGKHIRVRPRFDSWEVCGEIITVAPELTPEIVSQLLTLAGSVGLCDWRPGGKTPGPFGMFRAEIS